MVTVQGSHSLRDYLGDLGFASVGRYSNSTTRTDYSDLFGLHTSYLLDIRDFRGNQMKKLIVLLLTVSSLVAGEAPPEIPQPVKWVTTFADSILNSQGLVLAVYPSYARDITVDGNPRPFGFGMAALYPVSQYAFAGMRLDYLAGSFWAPSATVGAKYTVDKLPFHPTVFTVGGLIIPLSGAGDKTYSVGAITGIGVDCNLWKSDDKRTMIDVFIEAEKWTPTFPGVVIHFGVGGGWKF